MKSIKTNTIMNALITQTASSTALPNMKQHVQRQLNKVSPSLRAFSRKLTENDSETNDLYQDTALQIIKNAEKYKIDTNFKAWALTIMRNIFINNYRKKKRRGFMVSSSVNDYYLNAGKQTVKNDGETRVAYKELLKMVNSLPENIKRPFWMSYRGYKYHEIAEELGAPLGTIKSRIFFARQNLQKMYEQGA